MPHCLLGAIRAGLQFVVNFHADLHTAINLLCAALIINAKLKDISILEQMRARFDAGGGESYVV